MAYKLMNQLKQAEKLKKHGGLPDPADFRDIPAPMPSPPWAARIPSEQLPPPAPAVPVDAFEQNVSRGVAVLQRQRGLSPQNLSTIAQAQSRLDRRMRSAPRPQITNQGVPDPFYRPRMSLDPRGAAGEMVAQFPGAVTYEEQLERFRPLADKGTVAEQEQAALALEQQKYDLERGRTSDIQADEDRIARMAREDVRFEREGVEFEREGETATFQRQYDEKLNNLQIRRDELSVTIQQLQLEGGITDRQNKMIDILDAQVEMLSDRMLSAEAEGDFVTADKIQDRLDDITNRQQRILQGDETAVSDFEITEGDRQLTESQERRQRDFERTSVVGEAAGVIANSGLEDAVGLLQEIADDKLEPSATTPDKLREINRALSTAIEQAQGNPEVIAAIKRFIRSQAGFFDVEEKGKATLGTIIARAVKGAAGIPGWWLIYKGTMNTRELRKEVERFAELMAGDTE